VCAQGKPPAGSKLTYQPQLLGLGQVYFVDAKHAVDENRPVALVVDLDPDAATVDWTQATTAEWTESDLDRTPAADAIYRSVPSAAAKAKSYDVWKKAFVDALVRGQKITLFRSESLDLVSKVAESEKDFRARLEQAASEERKQESEKLKQKFAPKTATLDERIRRAEQAVEREAEHAKQSWFHAVISFIATVLGALVGRKKLSATTLGKATTTARGVGRSMKDSKNVTRAQETLDALRQQREDLDTKLQEEVDALESKYDAKSESLSEVAITPKRTNVSVKLVALVWVPVHQ
jgi:hypothetical protein